jgi:hypothetical protein
MYLHAIDAKMELYKTETIMNPVNVVSITPMADDEEY